MLYREDTGEIYALFPKFAHPSVASEGLTTDPLWFKIEGQ
jgi:hypothetical protein